MARTPMAQICFFSECAARSYVEERFDQTSWPSASVKSPIERIFAAAILSYIKFEHTEFCAAVEGNAEDALQCKQMIVFLEFQASLLDWPVDFALYVRNQVSGKVRTIAIECDGHEFHERTKQQAAKDRSRDRALQSSGAAILRFTGSELWNNPVECAQQTVAMLVDAVFREEGR